MIWGEIRTITQDNSLTTDMSEEEEDLDAQQPARWIQSWDLNRLFTGLTLSQKEKLGMFTRYKMSMKCDCFAIFESLQVYHAR